MIVDHLRLEAGGRIVQRQQGLYLSVVSRRAEGGTERMGEAGVQHVCRPSAKFAVLAWLVDNGEIWDREGQGGGRKKDEYSTTKTKMGPGSRGSWDEGREDGTAHTRQGQIQPGLVSLVRRSTQLMGKSWKLADRMWTTGARGTKEPRCWGDAAV